MTTTTRQHESLRTRNTPAANTAAPNAVRTLEVRWAISPDALVRSDAAAALLNGHAAKLRTCALIWRVNLASLRAAAALEVEVAGGMHEEIAIEGLCDNAATSSVDEATGLRTLMVGAHLVLVVRDDASHTLVYAKTSVLSERLGLTGGVYDGPM